MKRSSQNVAAQRKSRVLRKKRSAPKPAPDVFAELRKKSREKREGTMGVNRAGFAALFGLNKIKELEVKEKIRRGEKVKVAFIVERYSSFKTASLYRAMEKSEIFDPFILHYCIFEGWRNNDDVWSKYNKEYDALVESGYKVFRGYDEKRRFIDPSFFSPDIVITNAIYYDSFNYFYSSTYLTFNFLVCAFNYGFNIFKKGYNYYYNNMAINGAWIHFLETEIDYYELKHYSQNYGVNAICLGAPFLDLYKDDVFSDSSFPSITNNNPIVIYSPHWSVSNKPSPVLAHIDYPGMSNFTHYYNKFIELIKSTPEINFVFKPHPTLALQLHRIRFMSFEGFEEYKRTIASLPNGFVYEGADYIKLFKRSAAMMTDSASFIAEYLPSGHPCIYLLHQGEDREKFLSRFTPLAEQILRSYYLCNDWDRTIHILKRIVLRGRDPAKKYREELIDKLFVNLGDAGQKIEEYLEKRLTDRPLDDPYK